MPALCWNVPLHERPRVDLMARGTHGPHITEKMCSRQHWWLHVYGYTATLRVNGQTLPIRPGTVSILAPGVDIEYDFGERATHLCAHFRLPDGGVEGVSVPALQDAGSDFPALYAAMEDAAACFAANPLRAEVRVWDILWTLAERTRPAPNVAPLHSFPSAVQKARELVELRLGQTLSVHDLAEEVGVSHNHLTRLFRATVNDTVVGYIRARRVERARHLLLHTTLPVHAVAAQVGVEDVRVFYKLVRAALGQSPTQVRQGKSDTRTDTSL